ncbi:pyridoxal phosphate-dependent decarboxylase family protein [Streptomyces sp. 3211]|uniref:pyridoxal phosphate-dependent decarboxylase family protein n=1 Tax=Streptomyces sp. 3211 TaxID=1964449 RepID=UPI0013318BBE|nr:pyridoxal-dependent decarboxylase [Streptomyces sp. 3211]
MSLTSAQVRELIDMTVDHLLEFREKLSRGDLPASYVHDSNNAMAYTAGEQAAAAVAESTPPQDATPIPDLLDQLFGEAMTNGTLHPHPGFMAHVPSGGLIESAVGEFIAKAVNRFAGVWIAAPGYQQIEQNVIRWFCSILGYGEGAFGYLTTGGSLANFMAVRCALVGANTPACEDATFYTSDQGHFSVVKAVTMAGVPAQQVRVVPTVGCRMDIAALSAAVRADRRAGRHPVCVVGTAGSTNTGAIDDLQAVARLCRDEDMWFHADACFGGFFRLTDRGRKALAGIEGADSIAVDAHKSLFLPHGNSAILVKDAERLRAAFDIPRADYLPGLRDGPKPADLCRYGPELSREIRGIAAWLPLKTHGIRAFTAALDEKLDLADRLAEGLTRFPELAVVQSHPRVLPVVTFQVSQNRDATNRLCEAICRLGNTYVTTTTVPEHGTVIRACVLHSETNATVIDRFLEDVPAALAALRSTRREK